MLNLKSPNENHKTGAEQTWTAKNVIIKSIVQSRAITDLSKNLRGVIRCSEGVNIPCRPVTPCALSRNWKIQNIKIRKLIFFKKFYIKVTSKRFVRKDHGQSDLRNNFCVLWRMTHDLLNDNQLKISIEKSDDFCQSRQRFLLCMN